jgi:hypothetical protein
MNITQSNWRDDKLKNHYVYLHKYHDDFFFNKKFGSYHSSKVTKELLKENQSYDLLEIGIGAGNFYRYLKINKITNNYTGGDISENYVNLSKKIHSYDGFFVTDAKFDKDLKKNYDVVYCRNVAHHQTDPYFFLKNLINKFTKKLIVELRTRDYGNTNLDVNSSHQLVDGVKVPYIFLNYEELKNFFFSIEKLDKAKITINRNYHIFGGKIGRSLEKEFFNKETKASDTTIIIELDKNLEKISFFETFEKDKLLKDFSYYTHLLKSKLKDLTTSKVKK